MKKLLSCLIRHAGQKPLSYNVACLPLFPQQQITLTPITLMLHDILFPMYIKYV